MLSIVDTIGHVQMDTGLMVILAIGVSHVSGILDVGPLKRFWILRDPLKIASALLVLVALSWLSFEYSLGKLV